MRPYLFLVLFCSFFAVGYGQGAANNWYFGNNAAITFETSPPTALSGSSLNTLEGCSTISTGDGDLLFYTDGQYIYQADGAVMKNGSGLLGDPSSTQSAIIVPQPKNDKIFYVFTVDILEIPEEEGFPNRTDGINYSIVDYTNDPNGQVTIKNKHLLNFSAEKLSAVLMGCDSDTVWLVTFSTSDSQIPSPTENYYFDTFYAYAITPQGVSTIPVKSDVGIEIYDFRGSLKFSPDGKKLAAANVVSGLYLFDFDAASGRVSNPLSLTPEDTFESVYGVEFSPNNKFLYAAYYNDLRPDSPAEAYRSELYQFDLESPDVSASRFLLDKRQLYRSSLQLGPDGKIYRSMAATYLRGLPYLSAINNPNAKGAAANYVNNAVALTPGTTSAQGLPPFNQSLFNRVDIIQNDLSTSTLNLCEDETYTLKYNRAPGAAYLWTKNGKPISGATDAELQIALNAGETLPHKDVYELDVNLNDGTCARVGLANVTYYKKPVQPREPLVLTQCEDAETADGLSIFDLNQITQGLVGNDSSFTVTFYENKADAENENIANSIDPVGYENKNPSQTLYAHVANPADCPIVVPFKLIVSSTQANNVTLQGCDTAEDGLATFDLGQARPELLNGQSQTLDITFYASEKAALLEDPEELLPENYTMTTPYDQAIYARLENNNSCYAISRVQLKVNRLPDFELEENAVICSNLFPETVSITPKLNVDSTENYTYRWMPTGQETEALVTNEIGQHTLTVTNTRTGCTRSRTINIEERNLAKIQEIEVSDASENNRAVINITGLTDFEFALNASGSFQDENEFDNLLPGFYMVYVRSKDGCGMVSKAFNIIGFDKFFTPNGDGFNDRWQIKGVNAEVQPGTSIRIFDRYGKLLKQLDPLSSGWDGTLNGENLPSDDYWFQVTLDDGRIFKSHFTLKR